MWGTLRFARPWLSKRVLIKLANRGAGFLKLRDDGGVVAYGGLRVGVVQRRQFFAQQRPVVGDDGGLLLHVEIVKAVARGERIGISALVIRRRLQKYADGGKHRVDAVSPLPDMHHFMKENPLIVRGRLGEVRAIDR